MALAKSESSTGNPCGFTDEEMNQLYYVKASPIFWRQKAEELKYASDILFPYALKRNRKLSQDAAKKDFDLGKLPPNVFSQAFALLGFSLECLFKAALIRDNPNFTSGGKLSKIITNHNLNSLAALAKINLNSDEIYACKRLTEIMLKDFRYPINKEVEKTNRMSRVIDIPKVGQIIYQRLHSTVNQLHTSEGAVIEYKRATSKLFVRKVKKIAAKKTEKRKKQDMD